MNNALPHGVEILGSMHPRFEEILSPPAMAFLADLHRAFEPRRQQLLQARKERQARLDDGDTLDFLPETRSIREQEWTIAALPPALHQRRVEITGPTDAKMVINALNSGADSYMTDFEDSTAPTWYNQVQGQINVFEAVRQRLSLTSEQGKDYRLNEKIALLLIRPRGWHLDEKNVWIDGQRVAGGLFDFALAFFHNAQEQINRGAGPFYYLPKLESHTEARLWNEVFTHAEKALGIAHGTTKATVLIETITAVFEMDEILYELRDHSAGLNAGRWDYIFSCIKKFRRSRDFCLADRSLVTMQAPFMEAYSLLLLKTCHRRGAPAIGGMNAQIPVKSDPELNRQAIDIVRKDKTSAAQNGYDGAWVAHPALVEVAKQCFVEVLGDRPNQWDRQLPDVQVGAEQLLNFQPSGPVTEKGLRMNINVGIHYLGAWLSGNGCVPIHNLMEDAATAEISRSQVWQWVYSPRGKLEDGRKIDADLVQTLVAEELVKVKADAAGSGILPDQLDQAAQFFSSTSLADDCPEFLTLPLYEQID